MPRDVIPFVTTTRAGVEVDTVAGSIANGHKFDNASGTTKFYIVNGGASPCTPTIISTKLIDGDLTVANRVGNACAAGETMAYGPYSNNDYGDGASPQFVDVDIDYDTSVTLFAVKPGV